MIRFQEAVSRPTNSPPKQSTNKPTATHSANGRTREAFNAYQRDYMRRRRAAMKEQTSGNLG